jgi:hypothetical protein
MNDIHRVKALLDEINDAISGYDPVLKERARDILLRSALPEFEPTAEGGAAPSVAPSVEGATRAHHAPASLRELAREAPPRRASEAALLGAYYLSVVRGQALLGSQAINAELKRADLTVSNITRAIETNTNARPPLMEQVKKLGTTKQARKQYRITEAGVERVQHRLGVG